MAYQHRLKDSPFWFIDINLLFFTVNLCVYVFFYGFVLKQKLQSKSIISIQLNEMKWNHYVRSLCFFLFFDYFVLSFFRSLSLFTVFFNKNRTTHSPNEKYNR